MPAFFLWVAAPADVVKELASKPIAIIVIVDFMVSSLRSLLAFETPFWKRTISTADPNMNPLHELSLNNLSVVGNSPGARRDLSVGIPIAFKSGRRLFQIRPVQAGARAGFTFQGGKRLSEPSRAQNRV